MNKTVDYARGKWVGILKGFGIDENYLINKHGPCPLCGGSDRFRFDDKNGDGTYFCNSCGAGNGIDLLMKYRCWEFQKAASEVDRVVGNIQVAAAKQSKKDPTIRLKKVAEGCNPVREEDPVWSYLNSRRLIKNGIKSIKTHPAMQYWQAGERFGDKPKLIGAFPAMAALLTSPSGTPVSYHITYLNDNGQKAPVPSPKKILPGVMSLNGSAIRLAEVNEQVGIAEGIETALAVNKLFDIPCWAACNSTLLESFEPPEGINSIFVFADNDKNFTGHKAAYALANRLCVKGFEVEVYLPKTWGTDFAGELLAVESERAAS